jgi:thiol:disulfide interchange protein
MPTDAGVRAERRMSTRYTPRWLLVLAAVLLAGRVGAEIRRLTATPEPYYRSAATSPVAWRPIEVAEQESRATGRPILYEFSAEWCAPCKRLEAEFFADPDVAAFVNRTYVPVQVIDRSEEEGRNAPVVEAMMDRYEVRAFPTLVVTDPFVRIEGFPGRTEVGRALGLGPENR